jgi:hypothetical protein
VEAAHNMGAFEHERRQLPIRVAFAMTINTAQGLTRRLLARAALRRVLPVQGSRYNLCVFGPRLGADGAVWIKNVVYRVLIGAHR